MSGSGDLQPNSGLRYHTDADSPLPETINPIIDAVETNSADLARLASYNQPASVPYDSGDNGWRTITGIGFYHVGTAGDYPSSNGTLIHISLSRLTSIVFQMFLGGSGQLWTRRVAANQNFADIEWRAPNS